ncbi:MAG TPA: lipid-binding SYLF domain-containing protein [Alphaproteobacteria bacterium]|nr:lipid-binding SYLF domain-containing protein [Alphaproteobacteria bacterium]
MRTIRSQLLLVMVAVLALASCRTNSQIGSEPEQIINESRDSFQSMMGDNQYPTLVDLMTRAKAVIIVPNLIRAAFFFGGRGGNAVMLVRGEDGKWSQPGFYTLGGISWGLQFGGQTSELIITVMSDKGVKAIMNRQATLGADAGLAIGELGRGANAATGMDLKADMYAFARSEGLFVGVSLEGSVISPRETYDQELYGPDATPESILLDRTSNSQSQAVSAIVAAMP